MIIVDTAALLTREVYVKRVASKLRFCHCTLGHLTHSTRRGLIANGVINFPQN